MEEALRERHRMMPYLYTMNYRSYQEDLPLVEPMYYEYPEAPEAYAVKNQYFFGDQLMVAAVTTPRVRAEEWWICTVLWTVSRFLQKQAAFW